MEEALLNRPGCTIKQVKVNFHVKKLKKVMTFLRKEENICMTEEREEQAYEFGLGEDGQGVSVSVWLDEGQRNRLGSEMRRWDGDAESRGELVKELTEHKERKAAKKRAVM